MAEAIYQAKTAAPSSGQTAQRKGGVVLADNRQTVQRSALPAPLKAGIEKLSGVSMEGVRVHRNSSRPAQLQADAFTQGSDIHLAPGQERHLPHEAWHVVQQAQGRVVPTMQLKGDVPVNDEPGLEQEADVMGAKALRCREDPRPDIGSVPTAMGRQAIQMKPMRAMVLGISHLVRMKGRSLFRGDELPGEIVHGQELLVELSGAKRSRRGPNQEHFQGEDEVRGTHIYRWYRVLRIGGEEAPAGTYVREDAIQFVADDAELPERPGLELNSPPSLDAQRDVETGHHRTLEARALDRVARAIWIPMLGGNEVTPHIATTMIGGNLHVRGNTGGRYIPEGTEWGEKFLDFVTNRSNPLVGAGPKKIREKREKITRKLRALGAGRYHPNEATNSATLTELQGVVRNPKRIQWDQHQFGQRGNDIHGEMHLLDTIAGGGQVRDLHQPRTRMQPQHIGGVMEDCLFCHWAHALFNETIGAQRGIQITTSGTHGQVPAKWQAPKWMTDNPEILAKFAEKLKATDTGSMLTKSGYFKGKGEGESKGKGESKGGGMKGGFPPDSGSDVEEH